MSPIASLYAAWALNAFWPISGKAAARYADPLVYGAGALVVALVLLAPWLIRAGRWRRLISADHRASFAAVGFLGSGLTTILLLSAVRHTSAANAAIICQVEVVYSAILAAALLGERVTARQAAASALVLLGTGLVLGKDLGTPHWRGDLILLATPWMFQVSHVFTKRLPKDLDEITIAGGRLAYGAATLVPFALISLARGTARFEPAPAAFGLLFFQAAALNVASVVFWYRAIRNLELAKTTAIMLSYPALTLVYCAALGLEPIGWHQVAGLVLSLAGAVWLTFQVRRPVAPA